MKDGRRALELAAIANADALVVIPSLNEESYIGAVIDAIRRDPLAHRLLIVVVDGGSADGTCEVVSKLAAEAGNIRLIANPLRIQSAGVNRAAKLFGAGRRWLIRMDAHADYPEGYISDLVAEAERTGASSVVVAMAAKGRSCFQRAAAAAQNSVLGAGGSAHRSRGRDGFVDHGHHALFDMEKFLLLGGYDESQSHNEDAEFDVRLARSGGRIWLTRKTSVGYYPRSSPAGLYLQYRNYGRGRAATILRHRMRPKLRQALPAALAPAILLAAFAPWIALVALPAALWLCGCLAYGVVLGVCERNRCACAAWLAAAIMHIAWSVGFWSALGGHAAASLRAHRAPLPARAP